MPVGRANPEIHRYIYDVFLRHKLPVDNHGHFYTDGKKTVVDLTTSVKDGETIVNIERIAMFNDLDFILAKVLDLADILTPEEKRRGRPPKDVVE